MRNHLGWFEGLLQVPDSYPRQSRVEECTRVRKGETHRYRSICYDLYGETSPIFSPSLVRGKQIYIQPITEGFSNDMDKLAQNGSPGKKEKDPKRS